MLGQLEGVHRGPTGDWSAPASLFLCTTTLHFLLCGATIVRALELIRNLIGLHVSFSKYLLDNSQQKKKEKRRSERMRIRYICGTWLKYRPFRQEDFGYTRQNIPIKEVRAETCCRNPLPSSFSLYILAYACWFCIRIVDVPSEQDPIPFFYV